MSGTKRIRTFEKWVYRSNIDIDKWLKNNGISSILEWNEWCDKNKLQRPLSTTAQVHFGDATKELSLISKATAKATELVPASEYTRKYNKSTQEDTEPWHTPAAKRSRRKTSKRKKVKSSDS